jgi:hypothetical protein
MGIQILAWESIQELEADMTDTLPEGFERTNELAFVFNAQAAIKTPRPTKGGYPVYVLCQKWIRRGESIWVKIPVVDDDE